MSKLVQLAEMREKGVLSEEEFITKSVNASYQLAKRQITWLNKLTTTRIFEKDEMNKVIKIESFLQI